ncbi:MAG: 7-cyano-7-deazaguanine synthase QueC [Planctomycetes bacterium]|nr:7-cyano-7-deazaguanine synthase QueC [Planctomycetota bacterium]
MTRSSSPSAIVLASGGLDSTTVLAIAEADGFRPIPLVFRYGQRHEVEVQHAQRIAASRGLSGSLVVLDLPYSSIGGSSLLGEGEVPDEPAEGAGSGGIPSTYVPARNLVFLSLAVAVAEARGARDIYIGVNALDYSGYPDCRPAFLDAFARTANLATKAGTTPEDGVPHFRLHAPLVELDKAAIIRRGVELGVDYSFTVSCYRADEEGLACGTCDSCGLRRRGFERAGVPDPTRYRKDAANRS